MNHKSECIDNWQRASFGQRDSKLFKWSPYGHVWLGPRGINFI